MSTQELKPLVALLVGEMVMTSLVVELQIGDESVVMTDFVTQMSQLTRPDSFVMLEWVPTVMTVMTA